MAVRDDVGVGDGMELLRNAVVRLIWLCTTAAVTLCPLYGPVLGDIIEFGSVASCLQGARRWKKTASLLTSRCSCFN